MVHLHNTCPKHIQNMLIDVPRHTKRVRHEAGEALGAIGTPECIGALMQHSDDPVLEV